MFVNVVEINIISYNDTVSVKEERNTDDKVMPSYFCF